MLHATARVRRALGALAALVIAIGALGAPAGAASDGITLVPTVMVKSDCVLEVREDGVTVATVPGGEGGDCGLVGSPGFGFELGRQVRLADDDRVYFDWGETTWETICVSGEGCFLVRRHSGETWVTDGTEAGTAGRPDICAGSWYVGRTLFYSSCGIAGWSWVRGGETGPLTVRPDDPYAVLGDRLIHTFQDGRGMEPWATLGGSARRLLDIRPGPKESVPQDFRVRWGRLYYTANDGQGFARWVTDGTRAGTRKVPQP